MNFIERLLVYLTAVGVGILLVSGYVPWQGSAPSPSTSQSGNELILVDNEDRPRLMLGVNDSGLATIQFLDGEGRSQFYLAGQENGSLMVRAGGDDRANFSLDIGLDGTATLGLRSSSGDRYLVTAAPEETTCAMTGPSAVANVNVTRSAKKGSGLNVSSAAGESLAVIGQTAANESVVEVVGGNGTSGQLLATPAGETYLGVQAASEKGFAFFRSDADGLLELSLRPNDSAAGPSMSVLPSGTMAISVKAEDGATGAMMQLDSEGLAEVSVTGPDGRSGAGMMRLPDQVSSVFVRGGEDDHGPSMILLPNGESQIAVTAAGRGEQSLLHVSPQGKAQVAVRKKDGTSLLRLPERNAERPATP